MYTKIFKSLALAVTAFSAPLEADATLASRNTPSPPDSSCNPLGLSVYRTNATCSTQPTNYHKEHPQFPEMPYNSPLVFDHHFRAFTVTRNLEAGEAVYF